MTDLPYSAIVPARGFALGLRCVGDAVASVEFLPPSDELRAGEALAREAVRQLRAYLEDPAFVFDLPLAPSGTPYRQRVWQAIARIPLGRTRTYGDIAAELDSVPRAVGQACGDNPLPLIVPCHRVVAAGGGLGGFNHHSGGFLLDVKRWLLRHEGCRAD